MPLAIRSNSDSANARFRSVALLTRIRRCPFRPPLRPLVDHLVVEDEPALLARELAAFVVHRQSGTVALGAPSDFFGLFDLLAGHCSDRHTRPNRGEKGGLSPPAARRRRAHSRGRTLLRRGPRDVGGGRRRACPARARTQTGSGGSHRT